MGLTKTPLLILMQVKSIQDEFKHITGLKTVDEIEKWFKVNASREPKDLKETDLEYYITGMRPITFVVRRKGTEEAVVVGVVSD